MAQYYRHSGKVPFVGAVVAMLAGATTAAALGFLRWNWHPARLFMGDAGATFIGLAFAGLGVLGMKRGVPLTESALPLTPFLLDGTFTLARRANHLLGVADGLTRWPRMRPAASASAR